MTKLSGGYLEGFYLFIQVLFAYTIPFFPDKGDNFAINIKID